MSDIQTIWRADTLRGDWLQSGPALATAGDVVTAVLISLFTDRVANVDDAIPDGMKDPRGWWADDAVNKIGSRLWLLSREKQLDSVPKRAQDYCAEAVQWMLDDGVVARFDISASWVRTGLLGVQLVAHKADGTAATVKFSAAWNLAGVTFQVGDSPIQ